MCSMYLERERVWVCPVGGGFSLLDPPIQGGRGVWLDPVHPINHYSRRVGERRVR